jgi:predicted ATP-dependent serine protease
MNTLPRTATAHDLLKMHIRALPLNPRLAAFFGHLPANSQFNGLIWGNAGSAKSTLAFELAMELGRFGNVLYNTSEENFHTGTMQERLRFLPHISPRVTFLENRSLEDLTNTIATRRPSFVMVDSVSEIDEPEEDVIALAGEFTGTPFIFIAQSTGDASKPLGKNSLRHNVDFVIKCERRGNARVAINEKNRLAPRAHEMVIFTLPAI